MQLLDKVGPQGSEPRVESQSITETWLHVGLHTPFFVFTWGLLGVRGQLLSRHCPAPSLSKLLEEVASATTRVSAGHEELHFQQVRQENNATTFLEPELK